MATPTSVREGLVWRLAEKLEDDAGRRVSERKAKVAGGSVGALGFSAGVQFSRVEEAVESNEARLARICRDLTERGTGALLLVDEIQASSPDVRNLVATYQELVGEGLDVAMALAGLPASVSGVLNDRVLTFLNRARKVELGALPRGEVDAFLASAFAKCGVEIEGGLRRKVVDEIQGAPYLMQLVGHYIVLYAADDGTVSQEQMAQAVATARDECLNDICSTTLAPLSATDVKYLASMAKLGDSCKSSAVAAEMGVSVDYAQQYRRRMLEAGIIQSPRQGIVEFATPLLADYLRNM